VLLAERIQAIARLTGLPVRTGLPGRYNAASKMPATAGWQPAKKESQGVIPTGWLDIDNILYGGLPAGALHEWFGIAPSPTSQTGIYDRGR